MPTANLPEELPDCGHCRAAKFHFETVRALGFYRGDLREAVLMMKQSRHETLAVAIGSLLAQTKRDFILEFNADLLAAVPLHWTRRLWRGVNAAELVAEAVAADSGIPLAHGLLMCCRRTQKQGMLGPRQRIENVRGAFRAASAYDIKGARVVIVDDVMTTGATANEVAKVCRRAGADAVAVCVVARGIGA